MKKSVYTDRWGVMAFGAPVLALILLFAGLFAVRRVWHGELTVREGAPYQASPSFDLPASWLPGLEIEAKSSLPINKWAAIGLRLVDDQGDVLLELVKEAWRESGTWNEGSEAGTYDESDQYLSWTARLGQAEKLHVEVAILDMGDATADEPGTVLDSFPPHDPQKPPDVPVTVIVRRRTVDGTLFLLAVLLSGGLAILAYYRAGHGGIPVVVEQRAEGVVHAPLAWMGGSWRLVTVAVSGAYDEHGPESVEMNVRFKDASGREIHHASQGTSTWYLSADHGHRRFWMHLHFELPRGQYQVTVRAHPHQGMDSMKVIIRDGNTTRGEVDVTRIPKEAA